MAVEKKKTMEELRMDIDTIDTQLLQLLNKRAQCAIEVGDIKKVLNKEVYDPEREKAIINRMHQENNGPLDHHAVVSLFQRIIDESRRIEKLSYSLLIENADIKDSEDKK